MKRFLRGQAGASSYEDVEITWIRGRQPELTIRHDGVDVETINLSTYTEEKLHALFKAKGLKRRFSYDTELHKDPRFKSVIRYKNPGATNSRNSRATTARRSSTMLRGARPF